MKTFPKTIVATIFLMIVAFMFANAQDTYSVNSLGDKIVRIEYNPVPGDYAIDSDFEENRYEYHVRHQVTFMPKTASTDNAAQVTDKDRKREKIYYPPVYLYGQTSEMEPYTAPALSDTLAIQPPDDYKVPSFAMDLTHQGLTMRFSQQTIKYQGQKVDALVLEVDKDGVYVDPVTQAEYAVSSELPEGEPIILFVTDVITVRDLRAKGRK